MALKTKSGGTGFREEIEYIMMCVDSNHDGKVDFTEFTDRFHNPAKDIGFTMAVLLTNLSEHMPNEPRWVSFCWYVLKYLTGKFRSPDLKVKAV